MYDVAVVGLGAMGSAALYHLASRGARVVGLDAFDPPHALGSTHGYSRIIREAYFEHPSYVPLVRHAFENWAALEKASGRALYRQTGGLMIGPADSGLVIGTLESAQRHDIPIEQLEADDIEARFPALRPDRDMVGVLERNAGVLDPELCIGAHIDLARTQGAEVRTNTKVSLIEGNDAGVTLTTAAGEAISARRTIVAAGPWTRSLLESSGATLPLVVERQTMHWFEPAQNRTHFDADHLPVTLIEHDPDRYAYFIPDMGQGVKGAIHYEGALVQPDTVDRHVSDADIAPVRELIRTYAPDLDVAPRKSAVCLYTNTPDKHFLMDTVPGLPNVRVISACSGHGFKFASAIGQLSAETALGETPRMEMGQFRAERFS